MEWGYAKHPPLPTWLMGAAIAALRPHARRSATPLPAACFAATAAFTWDIGRRLLGAHAAAAALLLWTLQMSFSWRAQLYNHNTALVVCIAAAAWAALKAVDDDAPGWWAGGGRRRRRGAAVEVPGGGAAGRAAARAGVDRAAAPAPPRGRRGGAAALALALFAPHAAWVARHDFTTLRYAATSVDAGGATPAHALRSLLSFAANQLRMLSPMLLAMLALAAWRRLRPPRPAAGPALATSPSTSAATAAGADRDAGRWLAGLLWAPALLLAASAAAGVALRNHWGVQMFQFASLWIAWRWQRRGPIDLRRLGLVAVVLHVALLGAYAAEHLGGHAARRGRPPPGHALPGARPGAGGRRRMARGGRVVPAALRVRRRLPGRPRRALRRRGRGGLRGRRGDALDRPGGAGARRPRRAARCRCAAAGGSARGSSAYTLGTPREPHAGRRILIAVVPPASPCR